MIRRAVLVLMLALAGGVATAESLRLEGEVIARESAALLPPAIEGLWQLSITELVADGSMVKQGQPVLMFDGGQLQQRLATKQSELKEKQTQHDKLMLELADRERAERLATADRLAQRDKAQRKASQPEDLLRGVDYQKLVIERRQSEQQLALAERRETLAAEQRRQERRLIESERSLLETEVEELQAGLAALNVQAPRDGVMQHNSSWQGEKFDVGSQVWRGQSVADIPDLDTLEVRAQLPEREMLQVRVGDAARVRVEGGGAQMTGRVADIGLIVRSKSRRQPLPVLDIRIVLDAIPKQLKPGQAVRVDIETTGAAPGARPK